MFRMITAISALATLAVAQFGTGSLTIRNKCDFPINFIAVQRQAGDIMTIQAHDTLSAGEFAPQFCDGLGCTGMAVKFSKTSDFTYPLQFEYTYTPLDFLAFPFMVSYDFSSVNGDGGLSDVARSITPDFATCPSVECGAGVFDCGYTCPTCDAPNMKACSADTNMFLDFC